MTPGVIRFYEPLSNRWAVAALRKLENYGGAGLCARQTQGRPGTAAPPEYGRRKQLFINDGTYGSFK